MLNRWSVNFLLKTVIAALSAMAVAMLAVGAWGAFGRLEVANQVTALTDASRSVFLALNGLRLDRSFTLRLLAADTPAATDRNQVEKARASEMPAIKAALAALPGIEFPERETYLATLRQDFATLERLTAETNTAVEKPKAERSPELAKSFEAVETDLITRLDTVGELLAEQVKLDDAIVDEMLVVKQLGWTARSAAGDSAKTLADGMTAGQMSPEAQAFYNRALVQTDTAWAALQSVVAGTAVPAKFTEALAKANKAFFDPDLIATRDRLFKEVVAGQKPEMALGAWTGRTVPAIQTLLNVIIAALDAANDRAAALRGAAIGDLATQLGLLALALALGIGSFLAVGSRVTRPLQTLCDRMLKLAAGDLAVEVAFTDRQDEIGALAGTLATFKANAMAKARIEDEQKTRHAEAVARQQMVEAAIQAFEAEINDALEGLGRASGEMRTSSADIAATAAQSDERVQAVVGAAAEASKNVQSVAASTEQLSASSTEISGQVTRAATIANRAVEEARETDGTIQSLVGATSRIGEVVELITSIAGQTNLLALNATIEAARAGEAGKGFAVVASEVKSLANQTAKATEDISAQIIAVQNVTKDAVEAIQRIGGTIAEVSTVATSIASAVEEQAAATQEIKRSTQEAAQRTEEVSDNMTNVATGTEKTGTAAARVNDSVKTLSGEADRLRAQIASFLGKMRAA